LVAGGAVPVGRPGNGPGLLRGVSFGSTSKGNADVRGTIQRKGNRWYAVVYDGIDAETVKQRRRWVAAGSRRAGVRGGVYVCNFEPGGCPDVDVGGCFAVGEA
jgi:hypothetical protein